MYPKVHSDQSLERLETGLAGPSSLKRRPMPKSHLAPATCGGHRAVIIEPHPAVRVVLEHLLVWEGYTVEVCSGRLEVPEAASEQSPGLPVLFLVSAENGTGVYVFQACDVDGVLATLTEHVWLLELTKLPVLGIHAYVPKPFGILDILRVVRAVGGYDGRKKGP